MLKDCFAPRNDSVIFDILPDILVINSRKIKVNS